ncbi:MAG: phosphoribosylanthranilate isomerase [Candidatus Binatus sp.]|uniref:phosphoribosylanthranilate isomerase n=1 Tax=Candidatus Binatus sp. TaxID=2811406 RepID=UPI002728C5B1|nr:phosphoribosylanthranilate isomerase [Candidatus Binatus sp.]MDO8433345.1 phosphoribosylanthranilate isomerase [Candidatus Binatus sp.]
MSVRVKICGITRVEDADAAIAAGADMLGLNFFAPSPRYLALDCARVVRDAIGARAGVIGVFVNADRTYIEEYRRALSLDLLQFSGDEDDAMLRGWPIPVIATRRIAAGAQVAPSASDFVLLDVFDTKLYGGTGRRIPLDDLRALDLSRTFVAGGLTPDNVGEVAALNPYAVDCASGVESSPGVKDHDKIRSFVINAKRAR